MTRHACARIARSIVSCSPVHLFYLFHSARACSPVRSVFLTARLAPSLTAAPSRAACRRSMEALDAACSAAAPPLLDDETVVLREPGVASLIGAEAAAGPSGTLLVTTRCAPSPRPALRTSRARAQPPALATRRARRLRIRRAVPQHHGACGVDSAPEPLHLCAAGGRRAWRGWRGGGGGGGGGGRLRRAAPRARGRVEACEPYALPPRRRLTRTARAVDAIFRAMCDSAALNPDPEEEGASWLPRLRSRAQPPRRRGGRGGRHVL